MKTITFFILILGLLLVYLLGLPVTLLENDSAQFAVMAMRMVQEGDFLTLMKGPEEYLDKPHMHYWLAALSFKIFGIYDWAYRLPGVLGLMLGAYSCHGLAQLYYGKIAGRFAALIFLSAQTIVLSGIDVRTDAVLTGFAIFSIWQLATYLKEGTTISALLGAFGAGFAFSTKGQIALLVIGLCLICQLAYSKKWQRLFNWRVLVGILVFVLTITPMLYAYYHQFDLHPEKVIRGQSNRSGIFFIFWEQSFERLSGEGMGKNSSDYFFFFHTYLWVFLPWPILGILAYVARIQSFFQNKFRYHTSAELLTLGGITLIFLIISFAQFKLPHYMNILIPLYAVLSAGWLVQWSAQYKIDKWVFGFQIFIYFIYFTATLFLILWAFPSGWIWSVTLLLLCVLGLWWVQALPTQNQKTVALGVLGAMILNIGLNAHFYPQLLRYQGGSEMASLVYKKNINPEKIYKITNRHTWAMDFYTLSPLKIIEANQLAELSAQPSRFWIYADEKELETISKQGFRWHKKWEVDNFRITRLQLKFLNPETRDSQLGKMYLLEFN